MSMITATTWVPRGYAAPFPTKYVFDDDEYGRIAKLAKLQLDDAKEELKNTREEQDVDVGGIQLSEAKVPNGRQVDRTEEIDDDLKEYDLEHYDDADEHADVEKGEPMGMFGNVKSLAYYDNNADDPYIVLKEGDEDENEREDLQILPTDNLLLATRIEDEVAHLEVYVYEDEADNLYV